MNLIRRKIHPNSFFAQRVKYLLIFLNGFLLASLIYFYTEKQYEKNVFSSIASYINNPTSSSNSSSVNAEDSILVRSLHLVHNLGERRIAIFEKNHVNGIKASYIQPVSVDLMTAQGACGSHAYVLARLLSEMNMDVRIPQMIVKGQSAGHIIVEAKASYGWVVLDPLSNVFFRKPDGQLAGFKDVKDNWSYYQQQLPVNYNMAYRYEGVRYTNWDKIPVVMPLIKNIMYWTMGKEKTDNYSIRSLGLNKYKVLFNIALGAYFLVILFSINMLIKGRRKTMITKGGTIS
jgi:hypothetical protein